MVWKASEITWKGIWDGLESIYNDLEGILDSLKGIWDGLRGFWDSLEAIWDDLEGIWDGLGGNCTGLEGIWDSLAGVNWVIFGMILWQLRCPKSYRDSWDDLGSPEVARKLNKTARNAFWIILQAHLMNWKALGRKHPERLRGTLVCWNVMVSTLNEVAGT
jgi:hypothetical protein